MPDEAIGFYTRMLRSSPPVKPDSYTYSSILKACAQTQHLQLGRILHCRLLRSHSKLPAIVSNSLLNMYSTSTSSSKLVVQKVFDGMPSRNVAAWNTMILWYVKTARFTKALTHFNLMLQTGLTPSPITFVNLFPAVAAIGDTSTARLLYAFLLKLGTHYANHLFALSSSISMFSHLADMDAATKVFHLSPHKNNNIQVWNTMIGGYVQNHRFLDALHLFLNLLHLLHIVPDTVTFLASLTAVSQLQLLHFGRQLHAYLLKTSMPTSHLLISNALISMYSKCNSLDAAFQFFQNMLQRDLVSWNTMISSFVQNGFDDEGLMLVREMQKQGLSVDSITATALLSAASNLRSSKLGKQIHGYLFRHGICFEGMDSYLVDMYSKSGMIATAQRLFETNCILSRDHATWNAMIAGYTQNGEIEKAFSVLRQMLKQTKIPNSVTLASILPACIPMGGITLGKQIHGFAIRHFIDDNVFVGTSLVDVYSKCASIGYAEKMCNSIQEKNAVTYTTMILAYGQHGLGEKALSMFHTMYESGMNPDAITFVAILSACSYSGLVDEGLQIFESMESLYGIVPTTEHHSCVVDMLGRAGRVVEAYEFVKALGDKGNTVGIWGSLLGACRIHRKLELGKVVASRLFHVERDVSGYHVLLSNMYADKEMWDSADRVRKEMKERGLRKETGCSWIEIGSVVNCFTSRDQMHPRCDAIYAKLEELAVKMKAAGYQPTLGCTPVTPQFDE